MVCLLISSADEESSISFILTKQMRKLNKLCRNSKEDPKHANVVSVMLLSNDSDSETVEAENMNRRSQDEF